MIDEKEARSQVATTKEREEKERKRLSELESMITFIFDVCSKECCTLLQAINKKLSDTFSA
jgi:hypothetical protein